MKAEPTNPLNTLAMRVIPRLGAQATGRPEVPLTAVGNMGERPGKGNQKFGLGHVSLCCGHGLEEASESGNV